MIITALGLLLPFLGTALGAGFVVFMKKTPMAECESALSGFAAGVMTAASIWSLIIPAVKAAESLGRFSFLPVTAGIWLGVWFLAYSGRFSEKIGKNIKDSALSKRLLLVWAVVLHNIPEGMAVGLGISSKYLGGSVGPACLMLPIGIALQNIPEGAVISMPLGGDGMKKSKALLYGVLSGVVEPVFAFLSLIFARQVLPVMPYLLGFSAGAMLFVSVSELIPKRIEEKGGVLGGTGAFFLGFSSMMILDVVFS